MKKLVASIIILILGLAKFTFSYSLASVKSSTCYSYAQIPATVISQHTVYVSSKITGYIRNLSVDIGDRVKKGQILFSIDPIETYQTIRQARANLNYAKFIFNRMKSLYNQKVVSKDRFLETKRAFLQAKAQYKKTLNLLKYTIMKAPFDGIVTKRFLSNGNLAVPSQPVLELMKSNDYLISASIPNSIFNKVTPNKHIEINLANKKIYGEVKYIDPKENPVTHSHRIKIKPQSTSDLYPGEFCTIKFQLKKRNCLLIPLQAKTQRGSIEGVFVVEHNRAYFRMVRFGKIHSKKIEVLSGLESGQTIVINPPYTLKNNSILSKKQ